ncbi:lanthionine synthetase C family protein [Streptomyces sp. NPDC048191]|uniref:lanthionine synthetase C family protein n=1 Tax=Streptomyces sp. NPDC048191 TaxID=3155484 RepID=UPI0033F502CA
MLAIVGRWPSAARPCGATWPAAVRWQRIDAADRRRLKKQEVLFVITQSTALVSGPVAARATQVIEEVAARLAQPGQVESVTSKADTRIEAAWGRPAWHPLSLASGFAGPAILYGELSRDDHAYRAVAHRHISRAVQALSEPSGTGLFQGPAALLAAAQTCAADSGDYKSLRAALAQWLVMLQLRRLDAMRRRTSRTVSAPIEYDVIAGMSGTTRLLLDSAVDTAESADVMRAVTQSLEYLVGLTRPVRVHGRQVPGWWLPVDSLLTEQERNHYPDGFFDTGMAHGITGVLAVLCSALAYGHEVPGQRPAITCIAEWLAHWAEPENADAGWPNRVTFHEQITGELLPRPAVQAAWCYGTPGVAAALYRAGLVMGVPQWCERAVALLRGAVGRKQAEWGTDGPTICHGSAGFLQTTARVAAHCGDPDLIEGCRRITTAVLSEADEEAPFVFRHAVRSASIGMPVERADRAGLLEGAAGVACALLDVTRGPLPDHADRPWDRCFALA